MNSNGRSSTPVNVETESRSAWNGPPASMTVDFARLPEEPNFPAAETAVLGAVMLSPAAAAKLLPVLRSEHFTSQPHRDTLAAVHRLWERKQPIDPVLVHDQLRKDGHLTWGETKAALFIERCLEATYFPGNGTSYAMTVLEYAARRRAVQAGVRIAQAAARGSLELPELMKFVTTELRDLADAALAHQALAAPAMTPAPLGIVLGSVREELLTTRHAPDQSDLSP